MSVSGVVRSVDTSLLVGLTVHQQKWVRWLRGLLEAFKNSLKMLPHTTNHEGNLRCNSQGFLPVLITTSRRPTPRICTLSNDLSRLLPNSIRLTRGKMSLYAVVEKAAENGCSRLIVLDRWKMGACRISFYSFDSRSLRLHSPPVYIKGFITHLERKDGSSRIHVIHSVTLPAKGESARRLAVFLSEFLGLTLMKSNSIEDLGESVLAVSSIAGGQVRISAGSRDFSEGVPSLSIARVVWNDTEVQV